MPNNFQFLLRYQHHSGNREVLAAVELTLEKMAKGGIYDQIGGGFSRYSVDDRWHVPHFEKMLYDNAQLVSLYAEAYRLTKNPLFGEVVSETLAFINRELTSPEGEFYAALDADSEGVEGRFYVWKKELFENVLGDDAGILSGFFGIGREAYWEDENNVLVRVDTPAELALKYQMDEREAGRIIERGRQKLFHARSSRVRPGLDDKVLTSWNALMLKAYIDAYRALNKQEYLDRALLNAGFLSGHMIGEDGKVMRTYKEGVAAIDGFLDDYSFLVEAFIALYQITFDERWLNLAKLLADFTIRHFYDPATHMFFYTSDFHKDSVVRKIEVADGVMPASCSSLARGLFSLGLLYEHHVYTEMAVGMLNRVQQNMQRYPTAFSNWGILFLHLAFPYHTVVITGPRSAELLIEMTISYSPNVLFAGGSSPSGLPVCKNRWDSERTQIYVCTGSECQLPVQSVREAMDLIEKAGG